MYIRIPVSVNRAWMGENQNVGLFTVSRNTLWWNKGVHFMLSEPNLVWLTVVIAMILLPILAIFK
jgi:hypothetical protein